MPATPDLITWTFKGRHYPVLHGHYGFQQGIDHAGRPSTTVRPQVVTLTLDASDEDAGLAAYMLDPHQRASSQLEQRRPDGSVLHRLHIQAAHCVGLRGTFNPGDPAGWPGETLTLRLTAAALTLDGATLEAHSVLPWHAPEEVRRRARILGDETNLPAARAVAAPKSLPKVEAPARVAPPALSSNKDKGQYGEHISDAYMRAQGHTKLNDRGVLASLPPVPSRGTGIDGVWQHHSPPPDFLIVEAKYGTSQLGNTRDGKQMSDTWIRGRNRLRKAVDDDALADDIRRAMRRGRVEKRLHQIASDGALTETILL
jgi:Hemolysin coregulated protein Hcp (TssD)